MAKNQIQEAITHTPMNFSRSASQWLGSEVYFKLENQQVTGSFKIRGATNKILNLKPEERARDIVAG